jgi:hypothetical protein
MYLNQASTTLSFLVMKKLLVKKEKYAQCELKKNSFFAIPAQERKIKNNQKCILNQDGKEIYFSDDDYKKITKTKGKLFSKSINVDDDDYSSKKETQR